MVATITRGELFLAKELTATAVERAERLGRAQAFLELESVGETVDIGDGDRDRRMALSPQRRRDGVTEMHADSRSVIRPERQPVIHH